MKKITVSNMVFTAGVIMAGYGVLRIGMNYINLPKGTCPVNNYREYIIIGLVLTSLSLVMDIINKKKLK